MSAALELSDGCATASVRDGLRSPASGRPLRLAGTALVAGTERWPVVDGIAYLRPEAAADALAALDGGASDEAAAILLAADAGAPRLLPAMRELVAHRDTLSFREAMRALGYGPQADEYAHRWSDPSFLSGLALAEAYWLPRARVVEVGCGPGHFLRAFLRAAGRVVGLDGSFANLWLARHWVAPEAELVCFDAALSWPLADGAADLVFCQDSLHRLPAGQAAELRRLAGGAGAILCGRVRVHREGDDATRLAPEVYAARLGRATLHCDLELAAALIGRRAPRARTAAALAGSETISFAAGTAASRSPAAVLGLLDAPARGAALRRNPLYCEQDDGTCARRFPSAHYAETLGRHVTYPPHVAARARVTAGADPADDALIRRRVWVDLPPRW